MSIYRNSKSSMDILFYLWYYKCQLRNADVLKLVDGPDSKSGASDCVWVRFPPSAPKLGCTSQFIINYILSTTLNLMSKIFFSIDSLEISSIFLLSILFHPMCHHHIEIDKLEIIHYKIVKK